MGAMKLIIKAGSAAGAIALILSGCSESINDSTNSSGAAEDVASGDTPYQIVMSCDDSVRAPKIATRGQTWEIPLDVKDGEKDQTITSVVVEAVGASGDGDGDGQRGIGGTVSATIPVQASWGTTLYAKVGCLGSGQHVRKSGSGGWPNGGDGGDTSKDYGGGGSTSLELSKGAFTPIVVAGGGGGTDHTGDDTGGSVLASGLGGAGAGDCTAPGGTQSDQSSKAGNTKATKGSDGSKGQGGNGGGDWMCSGGGGGGGYQGGAGGCGCSGGHSGTCSSGGAGSSFVPGTDANGMNVEYSTPTGSPDYGTLSLTFMCQDAACATQPTPKAAG